MEAREALLRAVLLSGDPTEGAADLPELTAVNAEERLPQVIGAWRALQKTNLRNAERAKALATHCNELELKCSAATETITKLEVSRARARACVRVCVTGPLVQRPANRRSQRSQ